MAISSLHDEGLLLIQLSEGDQRAFKQLFDFYQRPLGEYVYKITESISVTEEIIQDVFIKLWLKRGEMGKVVSLKDYLFILCRNQTIDALRKHARSQLIQQDIEKYLLQESESDGQDSPLEEYREWIATAVEKLPRQQQLAYKMSRYERLKHEEIAARLNLSKETVKKHIQLAVKFIQNDLQQKIDTPILLILMSPLVLS